MLITTIINKNKKKKIKKKEIKKETNFLDLIQNFEFENIFIFLPLKEIINNFRISKIFLKILRKDDFFEDLGKIHFEEENLNYKKIMKRMKCSNYLFFISFQNEIPKNLKYFNNKKIKKIKINKKRILILTNDSFYTIEFDYELKDPIKILNEFKIKNEDNFDFCLNNFEENIYDKMDRGLILNQNNSIIFYIESFLNSKLFEIEIIGIDSGGGDNNSSGGSGNSSSDSPIIPMIESVGNEKLFYLYLNKKGELFKLTNFEETNKFKFILKNIILISPIGVIDSTNQFISIKILNNLKEFKNKKRKQNILNLKGTQLINQNLILFKNKNEMIISKFENHSKNFKNLKIKNYFVGDDSLIFKLENNKFYTFPIENITDLSKFKVGIKLNLNLKKIKFKNYFESDLLNHFPFKNNIENLFLSNNFLFFILNKPWSEKLKNLLNEYEDKMLNNLEKEEDDDEGELG